MIKRDDAINLISDLIRIESANTWLIPEGSGEREVQLYIQNWLREIGIDSEFETIDEGHENLVGTLRGTGGGRAVTLYAHADTVGFELWKDKAFVPEMKGDRLYGLGSCDDKGHCAAIMMTLAELQNRGIQLPGDVNFIFAADEEGTTCGTIDYVSRHEPTAALVLEAAPLNTINTTHQGFGWIEIITEGKAGHGSAGGVATDAIYHMAEVIVRMQRNQRENFAPNADPMNGETVYHTSTISGGTDFASYPEECRLRIEIGTQVGEVLADRVKEIRDIFEEIREFEPNFSGKVNIHLERNPFVTRGSEELYEILADKIEKIHGEKAVATGDNGWGDAQLFQDAGFPTLGFGATGGNLHCPDEWIDIPEFIKLVEILVEVLKEYCQ